MSFADDVARFAQKSNKSLDETGRAIALELFRSVILDTPVDTGRARSNWQTSLWVPREGEVEREQGAALTEAARQSSAFGMGKLIYLTNNLPYIYRLEFEGWSKQQPSGMVRKNVARIKSIIRKAAAENKV